MRGQIAPPVPPEETARCRVSEPSSRWGLPRVKPLSFHLGVSVTASSTAAKALLSVFCKGLFKNIETNIPQELNISPQGEEKSYKNIYHSARGQWRGKSETEQGSRGTEGGWEPRQNKTERQRENKRGAGGDNWEGDCGIGQE